MDEKLPPIAAAVERLRANLNKNKNKPGMTPKDIAIAGDISSFATVYRFMKPGAGASLTTIQAIERGYVAARDAKKAS